MKKNENQIPLIFIDEDVKFTYTPGDFLSNQNNLTGMLCPLFYLQISYNKKLYNTSSREIQNLLTENMFDDKFLCKTLNCDLEVLSKKEELLFHQKIVVFFNDYTKIDELKKFIQENENLKISQFVLVLIVDSPEKKVKENEKILMAQLRNKQSESVAKIFGKKSFLMIRNDSHIIA